MLVLGRRVGQELLFSTGLRLTVEEIGWDWIRLGLHYPRRSLALTEPLGKMLMLEPTIQVRVSSLSRRQVAIAIDAPQCVRVLRAELYHGDQSWELEPSSARKSEAVAQAGARRS